MKGTVFLQGYRFQCVIGIIPEERRKGQPVCLDVELDVDFSAAAGSDHIDDTVNYAEVGAALKNLALEREFQLVESFAAEGCDLILAMDHRIERVRITIRKPQAVAEADAVGVILERRRD